MRTGLLRAALDELIAHRGRTMVLAIGAALGVLTFTVMTELGSAGQTQLDTAIRRTQGRAGTVAITVGGLSGTDFQTRVVPEADAVLSRHGLADRVRFAFYPPGRFVCSPARAGASTAVSRVVLVDGRLDALAGLPTLHGDDWSGYVGEKPGRPAEACPPDPNTVALSTSGILGRLGLADGDLLVPLTPLAPIGPADSVVFAGVLPEGRADATDRITSSLTAVMSAYSRALGLAPPTVNVERVDTAEDFRRSQEGLKLVFNIVGVGALVLGGLAILNVQLMAVGERTRILGLYRAIGARRGDLGWLILLETFVTVVLGAAAGAGIAMVLSGPVRAFTVQRFDVPVHLGSVRALGRSSAAALVIGMLAGLLPAHRAARLDILQSLEHE